MKKSNGGISRRKFLKSAAPLSTAAAVFPQIVPRHVIGGAGHTAPSDTVYVAGIGVGSMGGYDVRASSRAGAKLVAFGDVDFKYAGPAIKDFGDATRYNDYRRLLEKETGIAPLRKGVLAHHGDRYSWGEIPEFLRGFAVTQYEKHKGVSAIRVLRPGTVWMAVSPRWGGGGSSSGGWKDEVISQEDYLKMGWQEIGSITYHHNSEDSVLRWTIYQRKCAANESFQFRTEKYLAPVYFFPPGMAGVLNRN